MEFDGRVDKPPTLSPAGAPQGATVDRPQDATGDASSPRSVSTTAPQDTTLLRPTPAFVAGVFSSLDATIAGPSPAFGKAVVGHPDDSFVRGASVGRYVLLDCIGIGGMGQVFAAYDPELDRKVAIKLVLSGGGRDSELSLLREAQGLARLARSCRTENKKG